MCIRDRSRSERAAALEAVAGAATSMVGTVMLGELVGGMGRPGRLCAGSTTGAAVLVADRARGSFGELELMAAGCLGQLVAAALAAADTQGLLVRNQAALEERLGDSELIGRSAPARALLELVHRVAPTDATVLLGGESGAGKEMVARAIHRGSRRAGGPFVAVNCAAIPDTLLESELFGAERGAHSTATKKIFGKVAAADGGTLFLDEIGDLPLSMQSKLLRAVQERSVRPVGAVSELAVNVRLLSATHKDLGAEVQAGSFRQDLWYRVHVFPIDLPPLRARQADTPTRGDLAQLYQAINTVSAVATELRGTVSALQNTMQMINQHLLDK